MGMFPGKMKNEEQTANSKQQTYIHQQRLNLLTTIVVSNACFPQTNAPTYDSELPLGERTHKYVRNKSEKHLTSLFHHSLIPCCWGLALGCRERSGNSWDGSDDRLRKGCYPLYD